MLNADQTQQYPQLFQPNVNTNPPHDGYNQNANPRPSDYQSYSSTYNQSPKQTNYQSHQSGNYNQSPPQTNYAYSVRHEVHRDAPLPAPASMDSDYEPEYNNRKFLFEIFHKQKNQSDFIYLNGSFFQL